MKAFLQDKDEICLHGSETITHHQKRWQLFRDSIHSKHSIQFINSIHRFDSFTQFIHSFKTFTQFIHSTHSLNSTHSKHSLKTFTPLHSTPSPIQSSISSFPTYLAQLGFLLLRPLLVAFAQLFLRSTLPSSLTC